MDLQLIKECEAKAQAWLSSPYYDEETKAEIREMMQNEDKTALIDAFYQNLEFGTGGLRGIMGAGTNRMNKYIVGMATQGFANYLLKAFPEDKQLSVVVGHDCRNNGRLFAETVAAIFSANGIKVYLFESLRPTPEVSFAIRHLHAQAGVNVTASHNPKEYNGYKAYWEDGAQVLAPHDKGIIDEVNKVKMEDVKQQAVPELIEIIGGEVDYDYMQAVHEAMIDQDVILRQKDLNIVYSAMHGAGRVIVPLCLRSWGFQNIHVVPEQMVIDGDFPTVSYPNPEAKEAFELGLALAKEKNADLVLATDPDADRLGVYVKDTKSGEYIPLTGNMSGSLLCEYVLSQKQASGKIPADGQVVKSIVTTNLVDAVAKNYGAELIEVLTGFKWIGKQVLKNEQEGKGTYLFGMEESYGCLAGTHARDKDAVVAVMCLCEVAAWCKKHGKTLYDMMLEIYEKYGYYKETQYAITLKGIDGSKQIAAIMDKLRSNPPKKFGELDVVRVRDYEKDVITELATGKTYPTGLPKSNVLYFDLTNDSWCCARPSGTEPKIKFYMGVKGTSLEDAQNKVEALTAEVKAVLD